MTNINIHVLLMLQLSLDLYYTEDEIYELSYTKEPKNPKIQVSRAKYDSLKLNFILHHQHHICYNLFSQEEGQLCTFCGCNIIFETKVQILLKDIKISHIKVPYVREACYVVGVLFFSCFSRHVQSFTFNQCICRSTACSSC